MWSPGTLADMALDLHAKRSPSGLQFAEQSRRFTVEFLKALGPVGKEYLRHPSLRVMRVESQDPFG